MNLNQLTKSYIKDIARIMKKWHLDTADVYLENDYQVVFRRSIHGVMQIFIHDECGEYVTMFIENQNSGLKGLLEEFEKTEYYMAKIKI